MNAQGADGKSSIRSVKSSVQSKDPAKAKLALLQKITMIWMTAMNSRLVIKHF